MAKRIALTEEERERFRDAAYDAYNAVGPESGWDRKTPSKATFVAVITDMMCGHYGGQRELTKSECERWMSLSAAEQRRIVLSVGP
jgi:hypothetical protein